ncbi:MAG: NUDIX hydrolase [Propioniciclava sp.]
MTRQIVAAGTVALQPREGKAPRILLVHRPGYDDWTLPKGKLEPDEYTAGAAARETLEETGVRVQLRQPLSPISYPVGGGRKTVHYWVASPTEQARRKPDREVDKVVWLSPSAAMKRMTYADEKGVVEQALAAEATTPVLVVRHGKAMLRTHWTARDQARPLASRGRKQSKALLPLLRAYGVERLISSSSTRCVQTFKPYSKSTGIDVEGWTVLSEEIGEENTKGVTTFMRRVVGETAERGGTAVCGHRPILPTMLEALDVVPRPLQTSAVVVAHVDPVGTTVAMEFHRPRA